MWERSGGGSVSVGDEWRWECMSVGRSGGGSV